MPRKRITVILLLPLEIAIIGLGILLWQLAALLEHKKQIKRHNASLKVYINEAIKLAKA